MKRIIYMATLLLCSIAAQAQIEVRFHNEASDTATITRWLDEGAAQRFANPEARVAFFANKMLGTPYGAHTLEHTPEQLTVNLDSVDCTTFVETAMALAFTIGENRSSWRDFIYNLRRLRYRNGEVDGYTSRLHYICDWAVDNIHRGNFSDVTREFPRVNELTRTIDFMSSNRSSYPALADSATYARIRSIESGYRQHKFYFVKSIDMANKDVKAAFHNGDVVALISNLKNLDVTHMGIVVRESPSAEPYLLHASSKEGKVVVTKQPMADFFKKNRQWLGVRVFRLND